MKTWTRFDAAPAGTVLRAALCVLMLCPGCMRHKISILDGYRLDDKGGILMLVPAAAGNVDSTDFQTARLTLPVDSSRARTRVREDCLIKGRVFSLHSNSGADNRSWVVRGPSTLGWGKLSSEVDMDAQWTLFIRDLSRLYDRGCFPAGVSAQSIRTAVAKRIPLPASEVPIFTYSDRGERAVDLAPGMEIRVQQIVSSGTPANPASGDSIRVSSAVYDVVSRRDGGIGLKPGRDAESQNNAPPGKEDRQLLTIAQRFAGASVLRLFLQGFSERESQSGAILIGAADTTRLDGLTDILRKTDHATCTNLGGGLCMDFPPGSVSLLCFVWINGRRTTCPFGTSLASLLFRLAKPEQAEVLESVQVSRQLHLDHYARIQLTRTVDGAGQILLLPGDRIDWKN